MRVGGKLLPEREYKPAMGTGTIRRNYVEKLDDIRDGGNNINRF